MEWIAIINAGISILETAIPRLREAVQNGDVTPEQQKTVEDRLNALRQPGAFSGPEWKKSGRT